MVPAWLIAVFVLLNEAWSARRSAQIRFLKLQIELLRQKAPGNRGILSPEDRERLLGLGSQLGHRVDDLISIVCVKTYRRWIREQNAGRQPRRVGRRRVISPSLRALIIRLANENTNWGVRRIVGELRKLALTPTYIAPDGEVVDAGSLTLRRDRQCAALLASEALDYARLVECRVDDHRRRLAVTPQPCAPCARRLLGWRRQGEGHCRRNEPTLSCIRDAMRR